ncbi:MAG: hypothetical protein AAB320_06175 [Elusimicrobiota bacterium]
MRPDLLWPTLLASGAATAYLSCLSKSYVFEGLARAMPIQLGTLSEVFKGTYLLYGALGYAFHGLLGLIGLQPLAVVSLQIMDAFFGAGGLVFFYHALRRLEIPPRAAAAWAAALGGSLGYALWSTDAQAYIFSTFVLAADWYLLAALVSGRKVSPIALGAAHAAAIFAHIVNGVFGAAILWLLWKVHGARWRRPALLYAASAAAIVLAGYAAVLILIVRPASMADLRLWLIGSLATATGEARWHTGLGLGGLWYWLKMTLNIFVSMGPAPAALLWAARAVLAVLAVTALASLRRLQGPAKPAAGACAAWLAAYALVFTSWEPHTMVYRVSDLLPLFTLLALGTNTFLPRWRAAAPALLAALLATANFSAELKPRSLEANNPRLARMRFIKAHTPENGWVIAATADAGNDELYIPFFAERRPIVLARYDVDPEALPRRLRAMLAAGEQVYATSRVLAEDRWNRLLAPFHPKAAGDDGTGLVVYRLGKTNSTTLNSSSGSPLSE